MDGYADELSVNLEKKLECGEMMTKELFSQAILKFTLGAIFVGLLVFVPAGTIAFWNGWLFMGVLFVPMFFAGIVLMIKNSELLKKRLNTKEKQSEQSIEVVELLIVMFLYFQFSTVVIPIEYS